MKKKKMLFIGSLPTKKVHFNGETNKTGDIYKILKKSGRCRITKINLTHFKLFNTFKMIFCVMLRRYHSVFISKCVVGGSFAIHLILKFGLKQNRKNIYFYWIGNGTLGLEHKKMFLNEIEKCRCVIFESDAVRLDHQDLNIKSYLIIPCIKPKYDLKVLEKDYSSVSTLKCIYFSRICEQKGLMDAIKAVEKANKIIGLKAFSLDIAGAPTSDEARAFELKMLDYIKDKNDTFTYFGRSFCVTGLETYKRLQDYDLHLFPSHFKQECVPGSVVDMFIAGVPTVSSSFKNVFNLLSENDSFIFEQGSIESFVQTLLSIYKEKNKLNSFRVKSNNLKSLYDEDAFINAVQSICLI